MSFSYTFQKDHFPRSAWLAKIEDLFTSSGEGTPAWRELDLSSQVRGSLDPEEQPYEPLILIDGSIRGVAIDEDEKEISLRLAIFASHSDLCLAARLTWEALALGATVYREGYETPITTDDLSSEAIAKIHEEWWATGMSVFASRSGEWQLPIYSFLSLSGGPEEITKPSAELEAEMVAKVRQLGDSYLSTSIAISMAGIGDLNVSLTQKDLNFLISKEVDAVNLSLTESTVVPLDQFTAILSGQLIDGGPVWFSPPINTYSPEIISALVAAQIQPVTSGPSDEEWEMIGKGPLIAFLLVAAADGKVDKKEINACADTITKFAMQEGHQPTSKMMHAALVGLGTIMPQLMAAENPMGDLLQINGLLNEKIGGDDAQIMKTAILVMAKEIAEASGGFFGFGNKIDENEKQALQLLASVFGDDESTAQNALAEPEEISEEESSAWYEAKSQLMANTLGQEHDMVMHAIIPFEIGGTLHLYYYPNGIPGTAIATKQLSESPRRGSSNNVFGVYELAMFTRHPLNMDQANDPTSDFGIAHANIQSILNPVARYSAEASLNANETCEFPAEMEGIGGKCLIFDAYQADATCEFGVLVIIEIHRSEMDYARKNGGEALLSKLKESGHYPYSDMARLPVV